MTRMTKTMAKKIIANMKEGMIYGIFEKQDSTRTLYRMMKSGQNIDICYYGGYCIKLNAESLCDWLECGWHYDLYLKPVRLSQDYITYTEI